MSCRLRKDQVCETKGCMRPARYGSLCPAHFQSASAARRRTELLADMTTAGEAPAAAIVSDGGAAWLARQWDAA